MPTSIAYDPSLTLGNIVAPAKLEVLKTITKYQDEISTIHAELNNLLLQQTDMARTETEIAKLGIDTTKILTGIQDIDKEIASTGELLADTIVKNAPLIAKAQANVSTIDDSIESPLDWTKSVLKDFPLGAPSFKMDSQYFYNESNSQTSGTTTSKIGQFVQQQLSMSAADTKTGIAAAKTAASVSDNQYQNHDILGTLVIACHCTHTNAKVFAPLEIDVDKAIRVWNGAIRDKQLKADYIDPTSPQDMLQLMVQKDSSNEAELNLLSGVTFGSSFVALIHVVNDTSTEIDESDSSNDSNVGAGESTHSAASSASKKRNLLSRILKRVENHMALANAEGHMGLQQEQSQQFDDLFSDQQVSVHINIICMGAIPTIASSTLDTAVAKFSSFDPNSMISTLNALGTSTATSQNTIASAANTAYKGSQLLSLQSNQINTVLQGTGTYDNSNNKYFDMNTLMTAFSNYVEQIQSGNVGIPINYYLAPITAFEIARLWVMKYLPESQFLGITPITNNTNNSSSSSSSSSSGSGDNSEGGS